MRSYTRHSRPQRCAPLARPLSRPIVATRNVARSNWPVVAYAPPAVALNSSSSAGFQPDPYVDYGRILTPEGGILIAYKDLDTRLRHTIWRLFAWTASTGGECWFLLYHSPVHSFWINLACLIVLAVINWLIVAKPVEVYRRIEIRSDCMILEDGDLFWRRYMEGGWPAFKPDKEGNQLLCGIYGTRFVEYLTVRRFDELDRTPEVIAAHLQDAMRQLWSEPNNFRAGAP
jgi:hypothetical protein